MDYNFRYSSLDTLLRSISSLKDKSLGSLLNATTKIYSDYIKFFKTYHENDSGIQLNTTRNEIRY